MRVGIDFGTTRTVVAAVDRGNYPVVSFTDERGDSSEHFPSVVAATDHGLVYGFDAVTAAAAGAPVLRSFKRALADPNVNAETVMTVGDVEVPLLQLLTGYLRALREALIKASNVPAPPAPKISKKKKSKDANAAKSDDDVDALAASGPVIEAVIAVPAHAHGAQRFLTLDAFRRAGFVVKAMINEPSAAGFEYTHRQPRAVNSKRTRVIVYDLGGGTFDASLVKVDGVQHDVTGTAGHNRLGGDDFDAVLVGLALQAANVKPSSLSAAQLDVLRESCRDAKERLTPQSKKLTLDVPGPLGDRSVSVSVDEFFAACAPLVEQSLQVMAPLLGADDAKGADASPHDEKGEKKKAAVDDDAGFADIAGIYLVGGGSGLPLVPRLLRERFGRRVHRSPHPGASTAIGLAIAADADAGFSLSDRLSRGFGVFRDREAGQKVRFDPIFLPESPVPSAEQNASGVVVTRRYRAAHNVGWFRYVECTAVDGDGEPRGDLVPFAEVLFAFDPALRTQSDLSAVKVLRQSTGPVVEERYVIDAHGLVEVQIQDLDTGYRQRFSIGA